MARRDDNLQARIDRDLARSEAPRDRQDPTAKCWMKRLAKGVRFLEVLATLIGLEQAAREQRALERRLREARLPKQKTLAEYDFTFPKRIPKAAIVRLVRLRLHRAARLCRSDWAHRNGKVASSHGTGLHGG